MTMRLQRYPILTSMLLILFALPNSQAEEAPPPEVHYYDLDPNIITNYQKPPSRRLGFITVDVQFQVSSVANLDTLEYHKPLIEDALIDVINSQSEADIKDRTKRKDIQAQIKVRLTALLQEETGAPVIEEVLFTKFIYK